MIFTPPKALSPSSPVVGLVYFSLPFFINFHPANSLPGIGLMIASALEHNGATVYIVGRRLEKLQQAASENSRYEKIIPIVGDVTSKESIQSIVSEISSRSGYINLLINNAGLPGRITNKMSPPTPFNQPPGVLSDISDVQTYLWEDTFEDWSETYKTNVMAPYFTTIGFLGLLAKGKGTVPQGSQVITVSSISGFAKMNTTSFLYNTSKAASTHLGKMLATSLTPWDIRSVRGSMVGSIEWWLIKVEYHCPRSASVGDGSWGS